MEAALFIMAIMGCGEDEAPCQQVRMLDARYESQAACIAATEGALMRSLDADFPVIVAECRRAGEASKLSARDVERPGADRR